jgi:hypothetical protein
LKTIILVGAGQIGSRYLQGLLNFKDKLKIFVIDKSVISLNASKARWSENARKKHIHQVFWLRKLSNKIPENLNLAIIATSSFGRADLIKKISKKYVIKYWIIEKILAQSQIEMKRIKKSLKVSNGAWVNLPRRSMPLYKKIKKMITMTKKKEGCHVKFTGCNWGILSNAVHFIELTSWLFNKKLISINTEKMIKKWYKSKRHGYFELDGTLVCQFTDDVNLTLVCSSKLKKNFMEIYLSNKKKIFVYEEKGYVFRNKKLWFNSNLKYQSEITPLIVKNIFLKKKCDLPTFSEAYDQHILFIKTMLNFWNETHNFTRETVPIT